MKEALTRCEASPLHVFEMTINRLPCQSVTRRKDKTPLFQGLIWPWKLANAGTPPVRVLIRHHASRHNMWESTLRWDPRRAL